MSKSALASLTAQYTDSENEDDHREDDAFDSQNSHESQVIIPKPTPKSTPEKVSTVAKSKKKRKKSVRRLVSYNDDIYVSDEEEASMESSEESESEQEAAADVTANSASTRPASANKNTDEPMDLDDDSNDTAKALQIPSNIEKSDKYSHYGFSLPPEPKGKPVPELMDKIKNLYDKMKTNSMDMNRVIQDRKDFRNPSIYEKLIQFCDINEFGTNYPPEIYDPLRWGPESYYEELARVQKNEMMKRQKERKESDKIEQATALARKVEEEAKKRKSKWDQPATTKATAPPALTTTVTGTKGTVISAFGSLPKKPTA